MIQKRDPLADALEALTNEFGITAVASDIRSSPETLKQVLAGTKLPSGRPRGLGPDLRRRLDAKYPGWQTYQVGGGTGTHHAAEPAAAYSSGPTVSVPVMSTKAAMGDGELQPTEEVVLSELILSQGWLDARFGKRSASLRFIYAVGDSMEPTIAHGAILLVDTSVREAGPDGIYVLETGGFLYVKRVRNSFSGGHEISSDNPVVKTVDSLGGSKPVQVLGRVVWLWNGREV